MNQKESFEERLEALARELDAERKVKGKEFVVSKLRWENWEVMMPGLVSFARQEIKKRWWRGAKTGVVPEGADANSVASEVVLSALKGSGRLVAGWSRERLELELKRMISNEVRRLHKLKEAGSMRNEWDVLSPTGSGHLRSVFAGMVATASGSYHKREFAEQDRKQREEDERIARELRAEDKLAEEMFWCLRRGIKKRREIAKKMGIGVGEVTNVRKRLERKLGKQPRP